jgi:hypothetical protein
VFVGYLKLGVPKTHDKKEQTPEESTPQNPMKNHIRVKTGHPRLRSDSHEARSTERLDPWENLRLRRPWVEPAGTSSPTYLQTKVKAFNAIANHFLPTWLQHRQHGSSTGVKSCFLLPIPGWAAKTCHYTHHAGYCSTIDASRGTRRRSSYPRISGARPYPFSVDPLRYASTRPRLIAGQQRNNACMSASHRTLDLSLSHP